MILNKLVAQVRAELPLDFHNIDDRLIIDLINVNRALYLKNELNKNRFILDDLKQTLTCLEVKLVEQSECPIVTSKHTVLKSVLKIPKTIMRKNKDSIFSVRNSLILSQDYNYVSKEVATYSGNGKVNRKDIYCFLYNNYIYIKVLKDNPKIPLLTYISVEGIFENPTELSNYVNCDDEKIYDINNEDFPMPMSHWSYIKKMVLEELNRSIQSEIIENEKEN